MSGNFDSEDDLEAIIAAQAAEICGLREALEKIDNGQWSNAIYSAQIAHAALAKKEWK